MAQRLWVVVVFSGSGYRGAKPTPPMAGTTTKEEGGCQGWVWAAGYLREEQLLRVWLCNRKILEEYEYRAKEDKPECG